MRILMLSQFYHPIFGGAERHVRDLSAALAARGHDVAIATIWHRGLPEDEVDGAVRVHRLKSSTQRAEFLFSELTRFHAPSFPDPELLRGLRRVVQLEQPDIIHAHDWLVYSFLPLKASSQAKLVLTLHDGSATCATKIQSYRGQVCSGPGLLKCIDCTRMHYGLLKGPAIAVSNWAMGRAERALVDLFIPVSQAVKTANRLNDKDLRVRVIPNFVLDDVGKLGEEHPKVQELPNEPFMLYVGAFSQQKGLEILLRAFARLTNPPPLVLIGYTTTGTAAVTRNVPPGVVMLKNWPHEAVMQAWHRCLFGLVPSLFFDSCPTTTIEAMAVGRPVIGSRIGGIPDQVVEGETGFLVPPGDVEALTRVMERLIADPALCARMGEAAKRKALEFQADAVVDRIVESYRELVMDGEQAPGHWALSDPPVSGRRHALSEISGQD